MSAAKNKTSTGFEFVCPRTGERLPAGIRTWQSSDGLPLEPVLPDFDADAIRTDDESIWRYAAMLPIEDDVERATIGEADTPLLEVSIVGMPVHVKLEFMQPTGSYKDRGAAVMATALNAAGVRGVVEDSSGNAGVSLAAYLARYNVSLQLYVPQNTPHMVLRQLAAFGADVDTESETRDEAAARAQDDVTKTIAYASHVYSPYFLAGQTTIAYELWEELGHTAPDNIVVPVGHGLLLRGIYLGFKQLHDAGLTERMPRLFGVQSRACSPIYDAFTRGADQVTPDAVRETVARGVRVPNPPRAREILESLRETGGSMLNVSESEIRRGQALASNLGWFIEPTAAVAVAGVVKLDKLIDDGESVVLPLTGSGLKT